jgi:phage-related protein
MQQGLAPDDWKPIPAVGVGTIEIRLHVGTEHRLLIVTKFAEALYVLHAFEKKSQKTSRRDITLARKRYRELIAERLER